MSDLQDAIGGAYGAQGLLVRPPAAPAAGGVYKLIAAVSAEIAQTGISKSRKNAQQGYNFRGIDETLNTLSPILANHGLVILPRMVSRAMTERTTKKGDPLFSVVVEAEFDFISSHDGSRHTVRTFGEAMDTADKSTNKAMSVAYKYAAFLAFCIPLEGMAEDADTVTHDVAAAVPEGFAFWADEIAAVAEEGTAALWAAWKASTEERRNHMMTTNKAGWDKLKAKAAKVTAEAAAAVPVVAS